MSIWGKILIFANVLAAIGFLVVAGMDWGKRKAWAEAVLEHQLVIDGVPLDDQEKDREGNPRSKDLKDQALGQLFQQAGGSPSKTQIEELQRVKQQLQARIDAPDPKRTKAQKLAEVLVALATTTKDRERIRQLAADEKNVEKNTEQLQGEFDQAFNEPAAGGQGSGPSKHTPEQRRQMIAHLLCATADVLRKDEADPPPSLAESKAYKRALATTGLVACSREVEDEATNMQRFFQDVRDGMARDRAAYVQASRTLLGQIEDLAEKVERQKGVLSLQTELLDKQQTLVGNREADLLQLGKDLNAAVEATKDELAKQERMEKELFKSRREDRDAFEKNLQLERQLRSLEKGR
jgi:hypothetical protein